MSCPWRMELVCLPSWWQSSVTGLSRGFQEDTWFWPLGSGLPSQCAAFLWGKQPSILSAGGTSSGMLAEDCAHCPSHPPTIYLSRGGSTRLSWLTGVRSEAEGLFYFFAISAPFIVTRHGALPITYLSKEHHTKIKAAEKMERNIRITRERRERERA